MLERSEASTWTTSQEILRPGLRMTKVNKCLFLIFLLRKALNVVYHPF